MFEADKSYMSAKHTISINGQTYDALTGMPIGGTASEPEQKTDKPQSVPVPVRHATPAVHREPVHHSASIHQQVHKSATLRRTHLAVPESKVPTSAPQRHAAGHIARSPMVSHFAQHPKPLPKNRPVRLINDIGPVARRAVVTPSTQAKLPSREVKERLIAEAGKKVDHSLATAAKQARPKRTPLLKRIRKQHFVAAGIGALLLVGYLAYLNMPGLSVRLAAAQAGVNASYPHYDPDGYSFQGPVAFTQGEVELRFKSNGGGEGYTIRQQNSNWNSVAVLDNLVSEASDGEYNVNSAGGITVYTYGTKAAWTNGGILYTIDGDAPLSNDQLVHIAASM